VCVDRNQLKSLIPIYKLSKLRHIYYYNNELLPIDQLNLIKYVDKNKFNNYIYWQLCRKFPRHFKIAIFNSLKNLLINEFKNELSKNERLKIAYKL
jgi:hypothetical protein